MEGLGATEFHAIKSNLTNDASKYANHGDLEVQWAMKAYHHAETYYNLISSVDPKLLKLTKMDDEIYEHFRKEFPDMKLDKVSEEDLKSPENKEKWRQFCNQYEKKVEDFNYGTLLRLDCTGDYSEDNSILSYKAQFLAIEIARNREGLNDSLRFKKKDAKDGSTS